VTDPDELRHGELRDREPVGYDTAWAHVLFTQFSVPQLTLIDLSPDEWLLYWKAPSYAPRKRRKPSSNVTQLVLFKMPLQEKAAGAETASPSLRLVVAPRNAEQE
jgi:hypothetical protein